MLPLEAVLAQILLHHWLNSVESTKIVKLLHKDYTRYVRDCQAQTMRSQGLKAPKHHRISASGTILDVMYFLLLLTQRVKKLQ